MSAASRTGRWCGWTSICPWPSPAALAAGILGCQRQISRPVDTAKLLSEHHPKLAMIVLLAGRDAISMSFRHDAIAPAIRDRNPQVSSGDESLCGLEYRRATIAAALCRGNYQRGLATSWAAYFLLPDFLTALAVFATLLLRLAFCFFLLLRAFFFYPGRFPLLVAFL